jgi:hypothetical protein
VKDNGISNVCATLYTYSNRRNDTIMMQYNKENKRRRVKGKGRKIRRKKKRGW